MIEIKSRYTGEVIYTYEGDTLKGADLCEVDLWGANLRGLDLRWANFWGANLGQVDFRGANLWGANFTDAILFGHKVKKPPIQINNLKWPILITEKAMQIGCQTHTHDEWEAFSGGELSDMDKDAFEFAEKWRTLLLYMCREHAK